MAVATPARVPRPGTVAGEPDDRLLGGYAALAEAAWMGVPQASEVLEPLPGRVSLTKLRLPSLRLRGLLTREFSIAEAAVILMVSFFISALLGAVRQVLFNAEFGTTGDANAYYAAFRLPDTLFSLIAGGALSSAMIPVLLCAERDDGHAAALRLTNLVLTVLLVVFTVICAVGALFAPFFVDHVLAPGFDAQTRELTVPLTRLMLAQPVILAIGSVATAVLNSRNRFLLGAISLMSHNLTLIAGIVAAQMFPGVGIYGPTLGVVAGAVLQALVLLPGLTGQGRFRPAFDRGDARLREVVRLLIPNGLAVGVGYAGFIIDTSFASTANDDAALAAILNAWLLVGLPIALLGQAIGQAAFPRLAAHAAALDWIALRRTLLQALAASGALAVPAVLSLTLLGRQVIRVLFEHGKFDAAAGSLTYDVLTAYAIALPAYVATEVITRGLISLRDTRTPLLTNCLQLGGRAAIVALFLDRWGAVAIPIAFAVTASVETLALGTILMTNVRRRIMGAGTSVPVTLD